MASFHTSGQHSQAKSAPSIPIFILRPDDIDDIFATLTEVQVNIARSAGFAGELFQTVKLPDEKGDLSAILYGAGSNPDETTGPIGLGKLSASLKSGQFHIEKSPYNWDKALLAVGWGLGTYKFDRYLKDKQDAPSLDLSNLGDETEIRALVDGSILGRDLINTPSNDMGPEALEKAARDLAKKHQAEIRVTKGDELLKNNYPMIHAVGRAAHEEPRLVEFEWGDKMHPRLAILGKGITFDTGGVNIKSASSARLMKKDMGGAAHALALAHMIMANNLPYRLHVLLPIAENAVSAGAYRPGDILQSRIGKTVEIDNTDAEGRLVLGDALTKASEDNPDLMIDFATLTGAARVALGPALPPFFCNHEAYVAPVVEHCMTAHDPIWHMPLWDPYFKMLSSPIADMKNAGGGFAGSVTAALFLKQFIGKTRWMHFDVYGWNPSMTPGRPAGGEVFALRGLYSWLKTNPL